jgi:hypothetical protein
MTDKTPANPASRTLFEILAARGLTVTEVARTAGISEGTLRAYRDIEGRGLNSRTLHKVLGAIAELSGAPASEPPANRERPVPSTTASENSCRQEGLASPGSPNYTSPPRADHGVYALLVEDATMAPRYEPGELIFVSSLRAAAAGDDVVIVQRNGSGGPIASVKRLLTRNGEEVVAEQFNPPGKTRVAAADVESIHLVLRMADLYG